MCLFRMQKYKKVWAGKVHSKGTTSLFSFNITVYKRVREKTDDVFTLNFYEGMDRGPFNMGHNGIQCDGAIV